MSVGPGDFILIPADVLNAAVTPTAVALYVVLSRYEEHQEVAQSRQFLADHVRCSVRRLHRALAELEDAKLIRTESSFMADGTQLPNRVVLL